MVEKHNKLKGEGIMRHANVLWYYDTVKNHDKVYVAIYEGGMMTCFWGRRGAGYQNNAKACSYGEYEKQVQSKMAKGYRPVSGSELLDCINPIPSEYKSMITGGGASEPKKETSVYHKTGEELSTPFRVKEGERAVVKCKNVLDEDMENFEKDVEYFCVYNNGLMMRVINMLGQEQYVNPKNFQFIS